MMKRLLIMVGCITICLLTNLSLRVPTPATAQATPPACQTAKGPGFVVGSGNNLFYLGSNVQFTTQSAGAQLFNFSEASNAAFGLYPGYAGTTGLGFSASGTNNTATAISCQDSFWDVNFEIAGTGATAGDVVSLYFQKPDGSGRIDLASFQVQPDNMSVRVISLRAGLDLSAIGHSPTAVGTIIPYSEAAGAAGKRTQLITIALPMDGSIPDCNQLAVSIKKDGNGGTTTVGILNIVVSRMGNLVQGTSVQGTGGTYATGLKCDAICPSCTSGTTNPPGDCQTAKGPGFVIGSGNNLFYLGSNVQFTTESAGAKLFNFSEASNAAFGSFPGYAGTTGLGFSASGTNNTATAISCQDSFWDVTFEIAGTGATAGDVVSLYFQKPDGSGRIDLASFQVQPDNMSVRVISLRAGLDLSAIGHTPTVVGTIIPYEEAAGAAGKRTQLITIALPMDGSIPDCNQLAVSIKKDGNGGTTTVGILNIVVNRMGNLVQGTSVNGTGGTYATGLKCDAICPKCTVVTPPPPPLVCDLKVCFKDPCDWCNELTWKPSTYSNYCVKIPFVNSGMPIMVYNGMSYDRWGPQIDVRVQIALGCGGYWRPGNLSSELIAEYVAAQLSFQEAAPNWYWQKLPKQKLACHIRMPMAMPGMPAMPPALPLKLSNGKTLDNNSSLQDLFDATEWAWDGTWDDREGLLAIYKQLDRCKKD